MPTSPMRLDTDNAGRLRLNEQIYLLSMPRRTRRNLTKRMGRKAIKEARGNIRQQRTIHGSPMADRKDARKRRKMLRGFGRGLKPYMRGADRVDVTWGNPLTAQLADRHQHGIAEPWNANKARKVYGVPDYSKPATRAQAKALKAEGYRLRVRRENGKGHTLRRVPIKWITENLPRGQAGLILRMMRTGNKRGKQRWEVKPSARPFLGPKPGTEDKFMNEIVRQFMADIKNR